MTKILEFLYSHKWAMYQPAFETMHDIVERLVKEPAAIAKAFHGTNYEAYLTEDGKPKPAAAIDDLIPGASRMEGTYRVAVTGSTAIIPVTGVIFPRNASVPMSYGAHTTVEGLTNDFKAAMANEQIDNILLLVDSPGGEITGVSEVADLIKSARDVKKVTAYVQGMAASAGYWISSAANEIIGANTSEAGSIGVLVAVTDMSERDKKEGIRRSTIVSKYSPNKVPDLSTEEGRGQIQTIVDDLAGIFVSTVAENRGVSVEAVLGQFGQGKMFVAKEAIDRGMMDRISTLNEVITELNNVNGAANTNSFIQNNSYIKGGSMNLEQLKAEHSELYSACIEEGKKTGYEEGFAAGCEAESARIQAIETIKTPGSEKIVSENKFNSEMTKESIAALILDDQEKTLSAQVEANEADAQEVAEDVEAVGQNHEAGVETEENDRKACVSGIVAGFNRK